METVIAGAALLGAGAATYGAVDSHRGRKKAEHEAAQARAAQEEESKKIKAEQDRLAKVAADERKKLNQGIARAGKRRIKGGLFGDNEPTPSSVSATLG